MNQMINFNIITLFPDFFTSALQHSLLGKAVNRQLIRVNLIQLRDFAVNKHGQVDDTPYGGGHGMVLMIEPLQKALASIPEKSHRILLSPRGFLWNQKRCMETYNKVSDGTLSLTLICGHYEGVDERVVEFIEESICIGDYILSGGEPAALVLIDSLARLAPGFMGNLESIHEESFQNPDFLEYPQYTKPADYQSLKVPEVLLSGHHARIEQWRKEESIKAHKKFRSEQR